MIRLAILLCVALAAAGCQGYSRTYEMGRREPFASYAGRDVKLTADVLVVERSGPDAPQRVFAMVPASEAVLRDAADLRLPAVRVPAGHTVRVANSRLFDSKTPSGLRTSQIRSTVEVTVDDGRFPRPLTATFDHSIGDGDTVGGEAFRLFRGTVRPAPWEPTSTPAVREVVWPTERELLTDGRY